TLYAGSGGAVRQKHELAAAVGIAPERLRVPCCDVGGNFGSRNRPYAESGLVPWAARKLARPGKYTATRADTLPSDDQVGSPGPQMRVGRVGLRRKNLVRPQAMPYTNAVGATYDSGRYEANMDLAMRIADRAGFAARRREAAARGKLLGSGLSNYVESST